MTEKSFEQMEKIQSNLIDAFERKLNSADVNFDKARTILEMIDRLEYILAKIKNNKGE